MSAAPVIQADRAAAELRSVPAIPAGPALGPADLAELFAQFNEVTVALQRTHDTLSAKAARLEDELKEANQQLRRSRELAALGEMAAGIAHEVRNPLSSISLYASMLEHDLSDRPEQRRIARRITEGVQSVDRIVRDVLAFARETRLRPERTDLLDVLRGAAEACGPTVAAAGASLRVRCAGRASIILRADPSLLRQALVNVITNAADAVAEAHPGGGGAIELDLARRSVRHGAGRRFPMGVVTVRDNGPGVPPDVMRRMFNPFFTTRAAGTGLGLAIVHRIVDAHGGRVSVRNGSEGGALVDLMLPLERADCSEGAQAARASGAQGGDS